MSSNALDNNRSIEKYGSCQGCYSFTVVDATLRFRGVSGDSFFSFSFLAAYLSHDGYLVRSAWYRMWLPFQIIRITSHHGGSSTDGVRWLRGRLRFWRWLRRRRRWYWLRCQVGNAPQSNEQHWKFSSSQAIVGDTVDYSHRNISTLDMNEIFSLIKSPQRIKSFQLNSNHLLTVPSQIEQFQSLVTMELSNNQLVQLPHEIALLRNLKQLYLKNNALDDLSLPKEFEQLKQLEVINLGGNRLKQFPYQLFQMTGLREIYLGSNQISFLPDLFQTLTR